MVEIAMMVLTVGLLAAAFWQVLISRDTARRQLRAYVTVPSVQALEINSPFTPGAIVTIKNSGQTPAYELTSEIHFEILASSHTDFARSRDAAGSQATVGVGAEHQMRAGFPREELERHRRAIEEGTKTLFVHGVIRYRDVFRKEHRTAYRCRLTLVAKQLAEGPMTFCAQGNEAS